MKERPILFSGPMVRAILEGRKTVTRRIAKPVKQPDLGNIYSPGALVLENEPRHVIERACPYGQPGDRLWVREAWAADAQVNTVAPRNLSAGEPILYPADGAIRQTGCAMITRGKTRPSIHMPRSASRIQLEITAVRVERLQNISEQQARAEGIHSYPHQWRDCEYPLPDVAYEPVAGSTTRYSSPVQAFQALWESINSAESWAANPWVWVVEFKRVTP